MVGSHTFWRRLGAYFPLGFSWLLMTVDAQVVIAAMLRKPNPEVNLAAMAILFVLIQFLGCPVADLTTTATTLAGTRQSYQAARRFALFLVIGVVAIHVLIVFTPLYWVVAERLIGTPHEAAVLGRGALMLTFPACGFIGWRKFCQGVLIRRGGTPQVGLGTVFRVTVVLLALYGIYNFTHLSGAAMGFGALTCGMGSEAAFAYVMMLRALNASPALTGEVVAPPARGEEATEPAIPHPSSLRSQALSLPGKGAESEILTLRQMFAFHLPLSFSTLIGIFVPAMIAAAISRLPDPTLKLAGLQLGTTFLWFVASFTFGLPDFVISRYKAGEASGELQSFSLILSAATSLLVVGLCLSGGDVAYFMNVSGATQSVANAAHWALFAGVLVPLLMGLQSYVRAMVTTHHLTFSRFVALGVATVALVAILGAGVTLRIDGLLLAGVAMSVGLLVELVFLYRTLAAA